MATKRQHSNHNSHWQRRKKYHRPNTQSILLQFIRKELATLDNGNTLFHIFSFSLASNSCVPNIVLLYECYSILYNSENHQDFQSHKSISVFGFISAFPTKRQDNSKKKNETFCMLHIWKPSKLSLSLFSPPFFPLIYRNVIWTALWHELWKLKWTKKKKTCVFYKLPE